MTDGIAGWVGTAAVVVAYDAWAHHQGRASMSRWLADQHSRRNVGLILAAAWGALSYHLFLERKL